MSGWIGTKRAEGWARRREAIALFRHMAELCTAVADALDRRSDTDAIECFARLSVKVATAGKLPCFPVTAVRRESRAFKVRQGVLT